MLDPQPFTLSTIPMTRVRRLSNTFDTGLVWFRRDLRNTDNAALYYALKHCERVWCVFVFDTTILQPLIDAWQTRHPGTQAQDRRIEFILAALGELDDALRAKGGGPALAWHDVPPVKAMFFSVVSCWRNRGAFIVFGALWFAVATTVSFGLTALMQALGAGDFAFAILMPATMIVTTMLYCSFYATYRGCFGVQTPEAPDLPTTPAA